MDKRTLLVADHIDKRFGITHAVNKVSLTIDAGEIRGLIGENGSGKSTFCQMLCGIYTIGDGTLTLDGQPLHIRNQVDANNAGISIIVQEMGTLSGLTVAENIYLGHEEPFMHLGVKDSRAMIEDYQLKSSFAGPGEMNSFVSMLFNEVEKSMTVKNDGLVMRTINSFIHIVTPYLVICLLCQYGGT